METEIKYKGYTIRVDPDEDLENPLQYGALGEFFGAHGRYLIGTRPFTDMEAFTEAVSQVPKRQIVFQSQVFLYDHSGLALSLTPFSCPWDSGCVGEWIVTHQQARKWLAVSQLRKHHKDRIPGMVEGQLKQYEYFINGIGYGYQILDADGDDAGGCWGYLGYPEDSGLLTDARAEVDAICNQQEVGVINT